MEGSPRQTIARWAGSIIATLLLFVTAGPVTLVCAGPAMAEETGGGAPDMMRLNSTGRVLMMPMPLKDGDKTLGEVVARINPDDSILVRKDVVVRLVEKSVKPEVVAAIAQLPDSAGHIEIGALAGTGAELRFDQAEVALKIVTKADLRTTQTISLGGGRIGQASARRVDPAGLSGYLNVIGGVDHLWAQDDAAAQTSLHFDLQSAIRAGDFVLENEAGYDGSVDAETCPHEAFCTYQHTSGLKRRNTRVVRDVPDAALRLQAGDTTTRPAGFQRITEILGVAAERSPRTLQPDTANRPTTSQTFIVERPSEAEISVNGTVVRRLKLQPGNYDLRDLSLVTGSNDLEVTLIDDTGARRSINRSTFFDRRLLGVDDSEWSLAGGLPSYYKDGERQYVEDNYAVSGFYRWGVDERLTGEVNAQADNGVRMAGAGVLAATPWGFFATRSAVSQSNAGMGFAVGVDWDLINFGDFDGVVASDAGARQSLRMSAEYRSDEFRLPGEFLRTASGLIYPSHDYWLRLSASYTAPLAFGISATLAGRYQFGREAEAGTPYAVRGDRYGADLTFSGALTDMLNGSLTLGYSNESYLLGATEKDGAAQPEFRVMARAFLRLDNTTHISASHDSLNRQSTITGYHASGQGLDRWEATVDAYNDQRPSNGSLGGTLAYYGNRGEARIAHNTSLSDLTWSGLNPEIGQQRTSMRVGTSIAFADGKVAVGAPVRGGFAIVYPHETLEDKTIEIGSREQVLARADAWGPAVVPNLPAYSPTTLPVDVDDLPVGYSLGAGAFDVRAPYRAGYALMVGSGHSVSAYGTLVDGRGKPLSLLSGIAYDANDRQQEVTVITNSAGRFAAEGLAPGRWRIEMSGEEQTYTYSLDVPKGTDGLMRAGTLQPDGATAHNTDGQHEEAAPRSQDTWVTAPPALDAEKTATPRLRGTL